MVPVHPHPPSGDLLEVVDLFVRHPLLDINACHAETGATPLLAAVAGNDDYGSVKF
jgi:hypothetical protein